MTPRVPAPGFGTSGTSGEECATAVERALETGYRLVDTAQMYDNERAVGEGIRRADVDREDVFLATKVHPDNLAPEDVTMSTRESLDHLGVEYLDLLYVHWPLRAYNPERTLLAFDRLHDEGLVRHVGASNFTPDILEEAIAALDAPVVANQVEMHPLLPQAELRETCEKLGITLVAYAPILQGEADEVEELRTVGDRHDATPAQVAIAWNMAKGAIPIPKATGDHVTENWAARDIDLDPRDLELIDGIDSRRRLVDFPGAPWNPVPRVVSDACHIVAEQWR